LVTHLRDSQAVLDLAKQAQIDSIQLHGLMEDSEASIVKKYWTKGSVARVLYVTPEIKISDALALSKTCDTVHLDSRSEDRLGGTGETHDWQVSALITEMLAKENVPVILAGGLNPGNLKDAIAKIRPYAVDVNSGVEDEYGNKQLSKLEQFISVAHSS
jgi:phosphoribosylanthranilate isomerase